MRCIRYYAKSPVGTGKMYLLQIFSFPQELEPITAATVTHLTRTSL